MQSSFKTRSFITFYARLILGGVIFAATTAHGANPRDGALQAQTLARFDARLQLALPSTPTARDLRVLVLAWLHERAADVRANDPIWRRQSILPWDGEAERAYVAEVEARAQAITVLLLRQKDRGRVVVDRNEESVVEHLAQVYATLATYRGNRSFQLGAGTAMALVPTVAVYNATLIAAVLFGRAIGAGKIEYWILAEQVTDGATLLYAGAVVTSLASSKFREYLRTAGLPGEPSAGADRIERAFWERLRGDLTKNRALRDFLPAGGDADYPAYFFSRLELAGSVTGQCESLLAHSPAQFHRP